ncbi:hypothetical protein [Amycolatopsis silviterrae]|uniref:Uncharacterized protein n=1 Tax=Amycolatopsis silviterrae TaxID=1656914 RepID=A0ABW5HB32_9PSEU
MSQPAPASPPAPPKAGFLARTAICPNAEVAERRDPDQITLFKAVGSGLAAAEHVLRTLAQPAA